jgi:uncharacterized protein (TIGR02246 family)
MANTYVSQAATAEQALRAVPMRTTEAWSKGDAEAFAAIFSETTQVVIGGVYLRSRDEVRSYIAAAFAGPVKGTQVVSEPVYVTQVDASTAVLITSGGVMIPGETTVSPARAIYATWMLTKNGGEWLIGAYHSSPVKGAAG